MTARHALLASFLAFATAASHAPAQFLASFDDNAPIKRVDPNASGGWSWYAGDGEATVELAQGDGFASMIVDARQDRLNVWWAVVRTRIDGALRMPLLAKAGSELRIEARVRLSHAPRRVNLQLFGPNQTVHAHLAEFDIPTAGEWRRISYTTSGFSAAPGDAVFCQLAMMDWGQDRFATDIDYLRVEVVPKDARLPQYGLPLQYHPPVPEPDQLPHARLPVADTTIDQALPFLALHDWGVPSLEPSTARLLPVASSQTALLRWDLAEFEGRAARGVGALELTTASLTRLLGDFEEIGRIRVVEIFGHAPNWDEATATFDAFAPDGSLETYTNPQPVIDADINPEPGALNRIAIPQPVLQRLIDGRSSGLAIRALGPVHAAFFDRECPAPDRRPRLSFAIEDEQAE